MDTSTKQSARRATLPVWGMVGVALLVSVVVLGAFTRPVIRAEHLLAEISDLREASRTTDNDFGRYVQAVNTDLRGAGAQDPDGGQGLGAATAPPDLRPLLALVAGEQASVLAENATAANALFDQMRQTLEAENRSSIALARHTKKLQEQQAAFTVAMLRLRSQIAQAEGRARLAAARAKAGADSTTPQMSLHPLLVEAMDLALQVKDLEAAEDTDTINNAINNQLEPSLARLTDLATQLAESDEKTATLAITVQSIVTSLRGDPNVGSTGILAAYGERRRLDAEASTIQSRGSAQLDRVRQVQETLRELSDTRTATVRAALRDSLRSAMRSAVAASVAGVLALTALAKVLAGNARRQVVKVREAEAFLRHTIDSLSAHTVVIGGDGRIRSANRVWAEFAAANGGAGPDALEGGDYLAVCDRAAATAEEAATVAAAIRAVLAGDTAPATVEYPCDAPNEKRWFMCSIRGFSLRNERFAVISHHNITAIKLAELELTWANESLAKAHAEVERRVEQRTAQLAVATEAAQAASKAKSEFLATMSHEIRTPLNGVVGTLELLAGTALSEQQMRYIQIGKSSAHSLTAVINDILDFSKIEAGRFELCHIEFDLRGIVEDVMEVQAVNASEKGLEVAFGINPALPAIVRGDPDRLRQIIINLVNNAIKFTQRGSITLRVDPVGDSRNSRVRFSVTDTGIGIPKERMDRLFKAFSQTDASFSRKYGGTGLGLAICKQLAELMGGAVGVESDLGKGSTFWFEAVLPAVVVPVDAPPVAATVDCCSLRVLVIEDHDVQREFIAECLTALHFTVDTASDGDAALAMMLDADSAGQPFAVVLTDHEMPGMDGIEVAVAMKSRSELAGIPIILLSSALDLDPARVRAAGFASHLTKPLRQSTLLDAVMVAVAPQVGVSHPVPVPQPAALADPTDLPAPTPATPRLRVLLAEDNEINQLIACELLGKNGFECTVAANGVAAVAGVLKDAYDLVLMDCQMPEMDGFDATREIRKLEQSGQLSMQHGRRLPIIALTANALKGDRERCLEAGMDGYSTKPIDLKHLNATIETLLPQEPRGSRPAQEIPMSEHPLSDSNPTAKRNDLVRPPLDSVALLEQCVGNAALLAMLFDKFEKQVKDDLVRIEQALTAKDAGQTSKVAHALKGAAGALSANDVQRTAAAIEQAARENRLETAAQCLTDLKTEVDRCLAYLPTARVAAKDAAATPKP